MRLLREMVGWMRREATRSDRRRWARWLGRSWARIDYAMRVEPTWLEVNHCEIPVARLPRPFHGFRLVQLSDLHSSRRVTPAYLDQAIELAQAQAGDVVVLTGDFIHHGFRHVDRIAHQLGRIRAPHGVYAVLGNHDYSVRNALGYRRHRHLHRAVAEALTAQGIRVLRNEHVALPRDGHSLHLVGVEDLWSRACDLKAAFAGVSPESPCVLLAHNPRTVELLGSHRCDLVLSGHTHGGQICLPGLGRPTLGRKTRRFAAGLYRLSEHTHLYVNKGVGFGFRVRYGVRPEVAVLSLRPLDS